MFGGDKGQDEFGGGKKEKRKFWGDQSIVRGNKERQGMDWEGRFK